MHLANRLESASLAEKLRARGHVLPAKQTVHGMRGGDRLDFIAKLPERQPVDARKQVALTPLGLFGVSIGKPAAQDNASGLQT